MNKLNELQDQIKALLEETNDKELVGKLTSINDNIKAVETDFQTQEKEYKDLLKDYKEVIVNTSFKPNGSAQPEERGASEAPKLEDFLTKLK